MGGASSEVTRGDHRRADRGGALRPDHRRPAPRAGTSCPARRPAASSAASTRRCRRPRPSWRSRLLVELGGGTARRRLAPTWTHRTPRPSITLDAGDSPGAWSVGPYRRSRWSTACRAIGCKVDQGTSADRRRSARRAAAVVAAGPADPADLVEEVVRLHGYDAHPLASCPRPPAGRGLTHGQRVRRVVADALAAARVRRGAHLPVRLAVARRRAAAWTPTTTGARGRAWPTRCPRSSPCCAPRSWRPWWMRCGATSARGSATSRCSRSGWSRAPGRVSAGPRLPVRSADPTTRPWPQIKAAVPPQPRRVALVLSGDADLAGWWGAGPAGRLVRPGRPPSALRPRHWAVELTVTAGRASRRGIPAVAPGSPWPTAPWWVTPASCTRRCCRRARAACAHVRRRIRPGRARRGERRVAQADAAVDLPVALRTSRCVVDRDVAGRRRRRPRSARGPGPLLESAGPVRRLRRASSSAPGRRSLAFGCASGPPTARSRPPR